MGSEMYIDGRLIGTAQAISGANDSFERISDCAIMWHRHTDAPVTDMCMRFVAYYSCEWSMMPAIQYDGNRCFIKDYYEVRSESKLLNEKHTFPHRTYVKGGIDDITGKPNRVSWMRMSIPAATYSEGSGLNIGMFLPPECMEGAASLYTQDENTVHEVLWPEQDGPLPLYMNGEWIDNFSVDAPAKSDFAAVLVLSADEQPRAGYRHMLSCAWNMYKKDLPLIHTPQELWDLGVDYAKQLYTREDDGFCGFSIGFTWQNGAWKKRNEQKYEIGWCGQNASLANSLLTHAIMTGDAQAEQMGFDVLDSWINATRPNGLIPTHYDDNMYCNGFDKTVDACNLGTAAVQFFESYALSQKLGKPRESYRDMALRICDFACRVMSPDGRIGKSWLESNLEPAVKDGSTGAFLTMALCDAASLTGKSKYMDSAKLSCAYYNRSLSENGYTTAGALDVFTIDKESSIPILKSNMMLYRLTGESCYLRKAEDAAWYLSTWQWHYSRRAPADSIFAQVGYDLYGGTAVSIHGGMDPYALFYVNDLVDLSEYTGNAEWLERAHAIWVHGQQCISDGTLVVDGKLPRPRGSQDESAATAYGEKANATSQWLVAWPTAFRLEELRSILPTWGKWRGREL